MTSLEYERPAAGAKGTVAHASFPEAIFGGVLGAGVLFGAWAQYYSAGLDECFAPVLRGEFPCLSLDPKPDVVAHPFGQLVFLVTAFALLVWVGSVYLGKKHDRGCSDPSIVDRLWSIVPAVYCWWMWRAAAAEGSGVDAGSTERLFLIACLVTAWACRLTWNFARKGGYSGGEDYRWVEVQTWMTPGQFEVFNLVFICMAQMLVLLGICTPTAAVFQAGKDSGSDIPLSYADYAVAVTFAALLFGEYSADNEMFEFQTEKYRRKAAGLPPQSGAAADGFISWGLWGISRHPNYFWCV